MNNFVNPDTSGLTGNNTPAGSDVAPVEPVVQRDLPGDHPGLQFLSSTRGEQAFNAAERHSGMVRRLRIVLPVIGVVVIAVFGIALFLRTGGLESVAVDNIGIEEGKLVMENPQLTGTDSEKRPYSMKAERALQDVKNPSEVTLETVEAFLQVSNDNSARLTAGSGFYNTDSQKLKLGDDVYLVTEDGMSMMAQEADIDIANGTLKTEHPVSLKSPHASISADRLNVENKGDRIIFDGQVNLTINPGAFDRGKGKASGDKAELASKQEKQE